MASEAMVVNVRPPFCLQSSGLYSISETSTWIEIRKTNKGGNKLWVHLHQIKLVRRTAGGCFAIVAI